VTIILINNSRESLFQFLVILVCLDPSCNPTISWACHFW